MYHCNINISCKNFARVSKFSLNAWPLIFLLLSHVTTKGFLVTIKTLDFGCHNLFCHRALLMHICTFPWKWKHELVWNNFVSVRSFLNGTFSTSISKLMFYFYHGRVILYLVRRNIIVTVYFITVKLHENLQSYHIVQKNKTLFFEKHLLHSFVNAELVKKLIFCVVKSSVSRLVTTPL